MSNNYDSIARHYDRLHHLFYGQSEINAQVELLEYIKPGDRVLILGGGTGWILERIAAVYASGLRITYIESSGKMMELSRKRDCGQNEVDFVWEKAEDWAGGGVFDCVLTGFFFDNFTAEHSARILGRISPLLKRGGYWLEADFYYPKGRRKLWQALLLKSMYASARLICGVEAKRLPDMERLFTAAGYRSVYTSFHYQRFIRSVAYQKKAD